jgi:hypothetical protein
MCKEFDDMTAEQLEAIGKYAHLCQWLSKKKQGIEELQGIAFFKGQSDLIDDIFRYLQMKESAPEQHRMSLERTVQEHEWAIEEHGWSIDGLLDRVRQLENLLFTHLEERKQ